jgi:hypothetical protein
MHQDGREGVRKPLLRPRKDALRRLLGKTGHFHQNPPDFAYFKLIRAFRFEKAHVTSRHKNGVLGVASVIATTKKEPFAA